MTIIDECEKIMESHGIEPWPRGLEALMLPLHHDSSFQKMKCVCVLEKFFCWPHSSDGRAWRFWRLGRGFKSFCGQKIMIIYKYTYIVHMQWHAKKGLRFMNELSQSKKKEHMCANIFIIIIISIILLANEYSNIHEIWTRHQWIVEKPIWF